MANAVLTFFAYGGQRDDRSSGLFAVSALRIVVRATLALLTLAVAHGAAAQTAVSADWTNLNRANFQEVPDGSSLNVGVNTVTINTRVNTDVDPPNAENNANFVPYYSTGMLSYYTGTIGAQAGTLLYNMDHSIFDEGDYFESTYTFATAVKSLAFTIAHVDRNTTYHHDGVVIEYDTGNGVWVNVRTTGGIVTTTAGVGTTTLNGQLAYHGTSAAASLTTTGNRMNVAFGAGITVKRVRIRYLFGQQYPTQDPNGPNQFIGLSDFAWTQTGVNVSDLSLTGSAAPATPASGATVTYTLNLTNGGPQAASGVSVGFPLPSGFTFVSSSATSGTFNVVSGTWSGITIASGQTRTLTITGTANGPPGVAISGAAEVASSPNYDPDSTPGNSVQTEDDRALITFTMAGARVAGTAPTLSCPAGSTLFDWDANPWSAGSLSNQYNLAFIGTMDFSVTSTGTWLSDPAFGGLSPSLANANNGGFAGTQLSWHQYLDFSTQAETATTTIALPTGVPGAQFTVFDIDYAANDFADKLTVTGSYRGNAVTPTLTNGVSNYVIGNSAYGDAASAGTSGDGNVVVTFNQPVDTITVVYGNHSTAPANPDGQAIAIFDITFCRPVAVLGVTKLSTVLSDPTGNTRPRAIPGAVIEYCILIQNPDTGTAANVVGTDAIPATLTYTAGSMTSGTSCASATTAEDDDAAGADETDPYGASVTGSTLTATANTLGPGSAFALKFRSTIN